MTVAHPPQRRVCPMFVFYPKLAVEPAAPSGGGIGGGLGGLFAGGMPKLKSRGGVPTGRGSGVAKGPDLAGAVRGRGKAPPIVAPPRRGGHSPSVAHKTPSSAGPPPSMAPPGPPKITPPGPPKTTPPPPGPPSSRPSAPGNNFFLSTCTRYSEVDPA